MGFGGGGIGGSVLGAGSCTSEAGPGSTSTGVGRTGPPPEGADGDAGGAKPLTPALAGPSSGGGGDRAASCEPAPPAATSPPGVSGDVAPAGPAAAWPS